MQPIIIVDDDATVRRMFRHALDDCYELVEADDFTSGERVIRSTHAPLAMLLDKMLPGGSGMVLLRIGREVHPFVPALVVTAAFDPDTARDAAAHGAGCIEKPFRPPDVQDFLKYSLGAPVALEEACAEDDIAAQLHERHVAAKLEELDARYAIGQYVHTLRYATADDDTRGPLFRLSQQTGFDPASLRRMARVTEVIRPREFSDYKLLRTPRGQPLPWSFLEDLSVLHDVARRHSIAVEAAREQLVVRDVRERIRIARAG